MDKDKIVNEIREKELEENKTNENKPKEEQNDNEIIKSEDITIDEKKLQKINQEIKENKKKNRNNIIKNEKYIKILRNVIILIVGMAYIEITLLGLKRIPSHEFETDLKVFIALSLITGIILFEKSYKADNFKYALYGIEILSIGGATIVLLDMLKKQSANMVNFFIGVLIVWIVYYIIKCIVIGLKKNYKNNESL